MAPNQLKQRPASQFECPLTEREAMQLLDHLIGIFLDELDNGSALWFGGFGRLCEAWARIEQMADVLGRATMNDMVKAEAERRSLGSESRMFVEIMFWPLRLKCPARAVAHWDQPQHGHGTGQTRS